MTLTEEARLRTELTNLIKSVASNTKDSPYYVARFAENLIQEIETEMWREHKAELKE